MKTLLYILLCTTLQAQDILLSKLPKDTVIQFGFSSQGTKPYTNFIHKPKNINCILRPHQESTLNILLGQKFYAFKICYTSDASGCLNKNRLNGNYTEEETDKSTTTDDFVILLSSNYWFKPDLDLSLSCYGGRNSLTIDKLVLNTKAKDGSFRIIFN
jgi:hypothetical protein